MSTIAEIARHKLFNRGAGKITDLRDARRCSACVVDGEGRGTWVHQCNRKVKETISGYGWCTQHGREIKSEAGELAEKVFYISGVNYNHAYITEIHFDGVRYTAKALYGGNAYLSKNDIKRHKPFDKISDATQNAIVQAKAKAAALREEAEEVERNVGVLMAMLKKKGGEES